MSQTLQRGATSVALWVAMLLLAACAGPAERPAAELTIVASMSIVGDVAQRVAGAETPVTVLIPPGSDPHTFEPRPQDVAVASQAQVIFTNGLELESFLEPLIERAGASERVVPLSDGLDGLIEVDDDGGHEEEHADEHGASPYDPHVWLDPALVAGWVTRIETALVEANPSERERYERNAAAYREELQALDSWIRAEVERIPVERRKLASDHEELGYFARAYGFEEIGAIVQGVSTLQEPTAQQMAALQARLREQSVPALFVGSTVNPRLAEALTDGAGVRIHRLYTSTLSEEGGPAPSYLEMMRYNVQTIVEALR